MEAEPDGMRAMASHLGAAKAEVPAFSCGQLQCRDLLALPHIQESQLWSSSQSLSPPSWQYEE